MGWTVQGLNPGKGKTFFPSPKHPHPLWPTRPLAHWLPGCIVEWYSSEGVKLATSLPTSARGKNEWFCTCAPPVCLQGAGRENCTSLKLLFKVS
jgi:hypothetical protein